MPATLREGQAGAWWSRDGESAVFRSQYRVRENGSGVAQSFEDE
jgi:hypothetical protein